MGRRIIEYVVRHDYDRRFNRDYPINYTRNQMYPVGWQILRIEAKKQPVTVFESETQEQADNMLDELLITYVSGCDVRGETDYVRANGVTGIRSIS